MTPQSMTWEDAVDAMMDGQVVTREAWAEDRIVVMVPHIGPRCSPPMVPIDWLSDDWISLGRLN